MWIDLAPPSGSHIKLHRIILSSWGVLLDHFFCLWCDLISLSYDCHSNIRRNPRRNVQKCMMLSIFVHILYVSVFIWIIEWFIWCFVGSLIKHDIKYETGLFPHTQFKRLVHAKMEILSSWLAVIFFFWERLLYFSIQWKRMETKTAQYAYSVKMTWKMFIKQNIRVCFTGK